MRSVVSRALAVVGTVGLLALSSGCATTSTMDELRAMAQDAKSSAAAAQQAAAEAKADAAAAMRKADEANACCRDTNSKIDRMFKKSMYK